MTERQSKPEDLKTYLSSPNFSRSIKCPRTRTTISYSEIGDLNGCPVLFIPPATCSRWFPVPLDQICRDSGIRLITIDRPGCGVTPHVTLDLRLETSCKHILSVWKHLKIEPRHLIAFSTGIYYALYLLRHYRSEMGGFIQPIFISPWIPPPASGIQRVDLIAPTMMPDLGFVLDPKDTKAVKLEQIPQSNLGIQSWGQKVTAWASSRGSRSGVDNSSTLATEWSRQASKITTDTIQAEDHGGIVQEFLLARQNGVEWFKEILQALSDIAKYNDCSLVFTIWHGTHDTLVPLEQHLWLQNSIKAMNRLSCKVYKVDKGNHMDLLWKEDGLKQAFAMIHFRERVYYGG